MKIKPFRLDFSVFGLNDSGIGETDESEEELSTLGDSPFLMDTHG